jgi:hypothetical protein
VRIREGLADAGEEFVEAILEEAVPRDVHEQVINRILDY